MKKEYLAHLENSELKQTHVLHEHLSDVAELAEKFICTANPQLGEASRWAGLLHDLGKYRIEFQDYLRGRRESSYETHHAVYGAALTYLLAQKSKSQGWIAVAFAIAAHHAGLHNSQGDGSLNGLVKNPNYKIFDDTAILENLRSKFESENVSVKIPESLLNIDFIGAEKLKLETATRMIFSSLVDADFLDTEKHYQNGQERAPLKLDEKLLQTLLEKLETARLKKVEEAGAKNADEKLVEIRNSIYENCLRKAAESPGFFSLTVPTGGAKTLAAMAFALRHALAHDLRRVIVVIPYLSIIEQNAKDYREIFGADVVIENHSSVVIREEDKSSDFDEKRNPLALAAENWDAPVIVTTSVQFIESLFSHKPSRCRKLHNIARSVVIFDEVQTLPAKLLEPLFSIWRELRDNYGVSFVFSTATQPAFRKNETNFKNGFGANEMREITDDTDEIFKSLNRVEYDFEHFQKPRSWSEIASEMLGERQILCVVNTRRHAFELWNELNRQKNENNSSGSIDAATFHLSSAMCAEHRLEMIETIKRKLKNGDECLVVSTQLIEAGVDLDFPVLFRAAAPLDSIVQAAGRCNREGALTDNEGNLIKGRVKVFTPADEGLPNGIYRQATKNTVDILPKITGEELAHNKTINGETIFESYFSNLYDEIPLGENIQKERREKNFRNVSREARVIDDSGIRVIVRFQGENRDSNEIIEEIQNRWINRTKDTDKFSFDRKDFQNLQRFMVNLRKENFEELEKDGIIKKLLPNKDLEQFVLDANCYDENLGVLKKGFSLEDFIQ